MECRYLFYEEGGKVGYITLNNPKKRNALSFFIPPLRTAKRGFLPF